MAREKLIETENDVKALVKKVFEQAAAWSYAPIQTGMGVHGIPDRVACVPVTITREMVGKRVGLFVAVEAKAPGRRREKLGGASGAQANIMREIIDAGGVAMLADGKPDADFLAGVLSSLDSQPFDAVEWHALLDVRTNKMEKQNG
jgi:hypothetical protein